MPYIYACRSAGDCELWTVCLIRFSFSYAIEQLTVYYAQKQGFNTIDIECDKIK